MRLLRFGREGLNLFCNYMVIGAGICENTRSVGAGLRLLRWLLLHPRTSQTVQIIRAKITQLKASKSNE